MLLILAIMKFILVIRLIRHRECTSLYLRINDIIGGKKVRVKLLKRIPLERLMDLKIDYAFKQLFGIEKNKDIAVVFLNAILQDRKSTRLNSSHVAISYAVICSKKETIDNKRTL